MASYLDARWHDGAWLIRIEDVDEGRAVDGAAEGILQLLAALGMRHDGEIVWQSRRKDLYQAAAQRIADDTSPCGCNRRAIADSRLGLAPDGSAISPGTCRHGLGPGRTMRSLRVRIPPAGQDEITFTDRFAGRITQHLTTDAGDFVLKRADGFWAYQLAVVVDDIVQGVTDIVRGADLLDSTPRQIYLQRLLGAPTPRYLHVPEVRNSNGEKLSKQTGAMAVTVDDEPSAVAVLLETARFLGLDLDEESGNTANSTPLSLEDFWRLAVPAWGRLLAQRDASERLEPIPVGMRKLM